MSYNKRLKSMTPEAYNRTNREIHAKYIAGHILTRDEQTFMCDCIKFENLVLYPFCIDEYYARIFLFKHPLFPQEIITATDRDFDHFNIMVDEWGRVVNIIHSGNALLDIVKKEARLELKEFRKSNPIIHPNFNSRRYEMKKRGMLEWSKYRYIMIKRIWEEEFNSKPYALYLAGKEVILDAESLVHILTRHYGQTMKTYDSDKSFFTKDILHSEIHKKLEYIFNRIDYYALYKDQPIEEINIRLNGTLYKIYCPKKTIGKKGEQEVNRLGSMFPIENRQMLQRIEREFDEHIVDNTLSVFRKK